MDGRSIEGEGGTQATEAEAPATAPSPLPASEKSSILRRAARIILPLVVIGAAIGVVAWLSATKPVIAPKPVAERVWTVDVLQADPGRVQPTIDVFGTIAAGRETELRPLVEGRIISLGPDFLEGAAVSAGALLVEIDPFDYEAGLAEANAERDQARAEVTELEAELEGERALLPGDRRQLTLSRADVERRERLFDRGAGSEKTLDDARLSLSQREQAVTQRAQAITRLEARLAQARALLARRDVAVLRAERDLQETRLTAPYDGYLSAVEAAVGMRVSTNDRVARLTVSDSLEARFHLSDGQFARLMAADGEAAFIGKPVDVIWQLGSQSLTFQGVVDRAEAEIDAARGGMRLFANLADLSPASPLRPGAFVTVRLSDQAFDGVVSLPPRALHLSPDGEAVIYLLKEGRMRSLTVEQVGRDAGRILVRGDLSKGDAIVLSRFPEMGDGVAARAASPTASGS
ncbi:MAG: efflux RND transporter periplasmic adaptor subunit [Magnetovibrionaceae bacterium]